MALPTTGNLSVRDIGAEIGLLGSYSLADCFANAIAGGFNPTYGQITDTNVRAFLGYSHGVTVTSISLGVGTSGPNACTNFSTPVTRYYSPAGVGFASATQLWLNNPGSTPASSGYYSDGGIWRNWNGTSFIGDGLCI